MPQMDVGVFQAMFAAVTKKEKVTPATFIFSTLKEKDHGHAPLLNLVVPGSVFVLLKWLRLTNITQSLICLCPRSMSPFRRS
jgi:hypothetical protein